MKRFVLVLMCAAVTPLVACNTQPVWSLKSDQTAQDAVTALKKLDARIETGPSHSDYSAALGDVNFSVKEFLDGATANAAPEFAAELRSAMKWYIAAEELWNRKVEVPIAIGYCAAGLRRFQAQSLCERYPELVTTVPGKGPSGTTFDFSVKMVTLQILVAQLAIQSGEDFKGSPGLIFDLAIKEAWQRAAFCVKNAKRLLDGQPAEKAEERSFKVGRKAEITYLTTEGH